MKLLRAVVILLICALTLSFFAAAVSVAGFVVHYYLTLPNEEDRAIMIVDMRWSIDQAQNNTAEPFHQHQFLTAISAKILWGEASYEELGMSKEELNELYNIVRQRCRIWSRKRMSECDPGSLDYKNAEAVMKSLVDPQYAVFQDPFGL